MSPLSGRSLSPPSPRPWQPLISLLSPWNRLLWTVWNPTLCSLSRLVSFTLSGFIRAVARVSTSLLLSRITCADRSRSVSQPSVEGPLGQRHLSAVGNSAAVNTELQSFWVPAWKRNCAVASFFTQISVASDPRPEPSATQRFPEP